MAPDLGAWTVANLAQHRANASGAHRRPSSLGPRAAPSRSPRHCLEEWTAGLWTDLSWARGLWSDEAPAQARSPDEAFPMMEATAAHLRPRNAPRVEARLDALLHEAHAALERMRARANEVREALREATRDRPAVLRGPFRVGLPDASEGEA